MRSWIKRNRRLLLALAALMTTVGAPAAVMGSWAYRIVRTNEADHACQMNLIVIDAAKEQWAKDFHKKAGDRPTAFDLAGNDNYIKAMPRCPGGQEYQINALGEAPNCLSGSTSHSIPRYGPVSRGQ